VILCTAKRTAEGVFYAQPKEQRGRIIFCISLFFLLAIDSAAVKTPAPEACAKQGPKCSLESEENGITNLAVWGLIFANQSSYKKTFPRLSKKRSFYFAQGKSLLLVLSGPRSPMSVFYDGNGRRVAEQPAHLQQQPAHLSSGTPVSSSKFHEMRGAPQRQCQVFPHHIT
jgi:hypothetical protein